MELAIEKETYFSPLRINQFVNYYMYKTSVYYKSLRFEEAGGRACSPVVDRWSNAPKALGSTPAS